MEFGSDASLRAPSRKVAIVSSRWLWEDSSCVRKASGISLGMDVDGSTNGRSFCDIQTSSTYRNGWNGEGVVTN